MSTSELTIYYVPYERKRKFPTHDERLQQVLLIRTQPVNS
jgi:hypothetical protein